jgi:hypothetical protein
VAHGDALHLPQPEPEIGAVAHENGAFRTCVEQQGVPDAAGLGHQPQAEAQVRAQRVSPEITFAPARTTFVNSETANKVLLT